MTVWNHHEDRSAAVERLIQRDLIPRGVADPRILDAMRMVPREEFLPPDLRSHAYDNDAFPIGFGQTISQPLMIGLMLESLRIGPQDRVLEIGTGSGYQAALLSMVCAGVVSVERLAHLAQDAAARLSGLGYSDVAVVHADGSLGYPQGAPYDRIIVSCGAPALPVSLKDQLVEGGILIVPVGTRSAQSLMIVTRRRDEYIEERGGGCVFVPLIGEQGWQDDAEDRS